MEKENRPGQFVTDELGRIVISYSSLRMFRRCRRSYFWRYLQHLVPLALRSGDPRELGKSFHDAREHFCLGHNSDDAILRYWGDVSDDHTKFEERERTRAMMRGYRRRWSKQGQADLDGHWMLLETKFTGDIEDPRTGQVHPRFAAGGKVDGALVVDGPRLWGDTEIGPGKYLYELKTASRVDGQYISKLWLDFQILWYSHYIEDGLRATGQLAPNEQLAGVLYDIVEKTKMPHTEGETEAQFEERREALTQEALSGNLRKSEKGGTLKKRNGESEEDFKTRCVEGSMAWIKATCKPIERESDQSFADRLDASYSNPEKFHRELIPISVPHREDIRRNVWELLWQHEEAEAREHWGKNEDQCFGFFRACDYLPICKSLDNPIEIENNFRLKTPHAEQNESALPIVD